MDYSTPSDAMFPTQTPLGTPIVDMSFDMLATQLVDARSRYFVFDKGAWIETTRFTYDLAMEVAVLGGGEVRLAKWRPVEGAFQ